MKKVKILFLLLISLFIVSPVKAEERTYDVNNYVYESGESVKIDKSVFGSALLLGDTITTNGCIDGVLVSGGKTVSIDGELEYGLIAGNSVGFKGKVNKDALLAGSIITVYQNAIFDRDAYLFGSQVDLSGVYNRNVVIYCDYAKLDNISITGNIRIIANTISIGDNVKINGTLTLNNSNATISDKAVINSINTITVDAHENSKDILTSVMAYVCLLVTFVFFALYSPKIFNKTENKAFNFSNILTSSGVGLLALILVPITVSILFVLLIGTPLAIMLLIMYVVCMYLSNMFMGYYVGNYIWTKFIKKEKNMLLIGLIGITILYLLSLIPILGLFTTIVSFLCGYGLIIETLKK